MESFLIDTPMASIILVFTIVTSIYAFSNPDIYGKFMLHPYSVSRGKHLYTLITSGLVHRDWTHLIFNMMTFFFFGFPLERLLSQISSWGHVLFAVIYVLGLVLSDIGTVFKQKENYNYHSLGASGAICAILFSFILFQPQMSIFIFFIPIPIPAVIFGPLFLLYCAWAARSARDSINHDAHFYGAIVGIAVTVILFPGVVSHFIAAVTNMIG